MTAKRQSVPGVRRPRDLVIDSGEPAKPVTPERTEKITVYFGDAELAELDLYRLELRASGLRTDRSRMIRAAIVMAMSSKERFEKALRKGDGA